MAKIIPTTLALLLLASAAQADTLLIDGIDVDKQSADTPAEARHVDDGCRVDLWRPGSAPRRRRRRHRRATADHALGLSVVLGVLRER